MLSTLAATLRAHVSNTRLQRADDGAHGDRGPLLRAIPGIGALAVLAAVGLLLAGTATQGQTPVALPYTTSTYAGLYPMSATVGAQCPNLPTGTVSTSTYGDGCLAINGIFSTNNTGLGIDSLGTLFINDTSNNVIHMVDPNSGIMTKLVGGASAVCSTGVLTSMGDGCPFANVKGLSNDVAFSVDPWGNPIFGYYNDLHIVCRTASPNCASAQVGTMQLLAGCVASPGSSGSFASESTSQIGLSNYPAKVLGSACNATSGGLPGQAQASGSDRFGNTYFYDSATSRYRVILGPQTSTYFTGNNPLWAALGVYYTSLTAGYAYSVINTVDSAACETTGQPSATCVGSQTYMVPKATACSITTSGTTYSGTSTDALGDGCPFPFSQVVAASYPGRQSLAVDAAGNMLFVDPNDGLRVFFVSSAGTTGALVANAIKANYSGITPTPGFVYTLVGGGATVMSVTAPALGTPVLGSSVNYSDTGRTQITISPQGHIFWDSTTSVYMFDINTGYARKMYGAGSNIGAGTVCSTGSSLTSLDKYSDGCPAGNANWGTSYGTGMTTDLQGNLYLLDYRSSNAASNVKVRKILAQGVVPQYLNSAATAATPIVVGTTYKQTFYVHIPESVTGSVTGATAAQTIDADVTLGAPVCTQNTDNSVDCTVLATIIPSSPGSRSAKATIMLPTGTAWTNGTGSFSIIYTASGSYMATDNGVTTINGTTAPVAPTTATVLSGATAVGVAVDGAGNVYTMDTGSTSVKESIGGTVSSIYSSLPTTPSGIAVDTLDNVYTVGTGTTTVQKLTVSAAGSPATYTASTVAYTPASGTATPQAVAVDSFGNVYVADYQPGSASAIYRVSQTTSVGLTQFTVASGLNNPTGVAVDANGNVYVADKGAGILYKYALSLSTGVPVYTQSTLLSGITPVAVNVDAANNVYVQDASSKTIIEVPVTGPAKVTVLTGLSSPTGIAIDTVGNVYSADAGKVTQVQRNNVTQNLGTGGTTTAATYTATLTNIGNATSYGQYTGSTGADVNIAVVAGASNGCSFSASNFLIGASSTNTTTVPSGAACTLSASMTGTGSVTANDYINLAAASSAPGTQVVNSGGLLTLTGTPASGASYATTTTIADNTASPVYSASGTEVALTISVTAATASAAPAGSVLYYLDGSTTGVSSSLTAQNSTTATASVNLSGLTAGTHTVTASYATTGSYTGSTTASTTSFTIAPAPTAVVWSPSATTQQYSAAIGLGVLDASGTAGGAAVPGVVIYQATNTGTNATVYVHSASFLPIGTYTLTATFVPTDNIDYATSTATVSNYVVSKATTTASIGATQNLIAADGTGNFTSVQSALNALPTTGGSLYIKPGTYTGFVSLNIPNTSIYGLGGDPTKVIVTNEWGAFSAPYLANQGPGNNGQQGDPGSATFYIARSTVNGYNGIPSNIYLDNFSINNTWDLDTTNLDYNHYVGSGCVTETTGYSNWVLFNGGASEASPGLCGGQALAIYATSDMTVFNNVYTTSGQDTFFSGAQGTNSSGGGNPARQYFFRGFISGVVDYLWGDSALVMDYTSVLASTRGGTSFEAQNKRFQTGSSGDYLSGYVMNSSVFTSASSSQSVTYGRPYGSYSTYLMLNCFVDQVIPAGWSEFAGDTNLPTSTYAEYNTLPYTDPATGSPDLNGVLYSGTGGSSGSGVTGTRETTSQSPGTPMANNTLKTSMTLAQAQAYFPTNFLSATVPISSLNAVTNWIPTTALATGVNAFATGGKTTSIAAGSSVTLLMRPQVPGLGAITNGSYTVPTGSYILSDTLGGVTTTLASGSLDASGEAYYISSSLAAGTHNLSWTYSGDSNFSGSATSSPYVLTVTGSSSVTTLSTSTNPITYGQSASITATVSPSSGTGTPTGTVILTIDGSTTKSSALSNGAATFTVTGLTAGSHTFSASYGGGGGYNASSTSVNLSLTVNQATLTLTGVCANRIFGAANSCTTPTIGGYQYTDSASTVFTATPTSTTTATRSSPAGSYSATPVYTLSTFGSTNYTVSAVSGSFTVSGGAPQAIIFPALPNFAHGASYQLSARTTSGLAVAYTVTTGSASVSGNTLTVTGTGTVTVQASTVTDPTGDYAAATPVSRSFTAQ